MVTLPKEEITISGHKSAQYDSRTEDGIYVEAKTGHRIGDYSKKSPWFKETSDRLKRFDEVAKHCGIRWVIAVNNSSGHVNLQMLHRGYPYVLILFGK